MQIMRQQFFYILVISQAVTNVYAQLIDRQQLVSRHTVVNSRFDSLSSLSVGNGAFVTVDVTGLQ